MKPFIMNSLNNSCYIFPRPKFPHGLYLTYDSCPDSFSNSTSKLITACCFLIITSTISQGSNYKKAQDLLRDYTASFLVIPAFLFNVLSLIVLNKFCKSKSSASQTSTTFYMRSICIFDALTILFKFIHEIVVVRNSTRANQIVITSFMCKFIAFSEAVCAISSIYLLIAMSVDKLICVLRPLKVGQLLTKTKAKVVVSVIILSASMFSSYELFDQKAVKLISINEGSHAETSNLDQNEAEISENNIESSNSYNNISYYKYDCDSRSPQRLNDWVLINNIVKVFLPIIVLCFFNSWIAIALARARRNTEALFREGSFREDKSNKRFNKTGFKHYNNNNQQRYFLTKNFSTPNLKPKTIHFKDSTDNFIAEENYMLTNSTFNGKISKSINSDKMNSLNNDNNIAARGNGRNIRHIRGKNSTQHISIMLLAISLGFVVLNLPFAIKTLFYRYLVKHFKFIDYLYHDDFFLTGYSKQDVESSIRFEFFSYLTYTLVDLNYIANFFLYFFSGSRFRSQLFSIVACKKERKLYTSYYNSNIHKGDLVQQQMISKNNALVRKNSINNNNSKIDHRQPLKLDSESRKKRSICSNLFYFLKKKDRKNFQSNDRLNKFSLENRNAIYD